MYFVYVIQNPSGMLYKGHTNDVQRRLSEHNDDRICGYTKGKGPWNLVYAEACSSRAEAMKREKFLKTGKGREYLEKVIKQLV